MDVKLFKLLRDEQGQGLVEYTLIIALISILGVAALTIIGQGANSKLNNAALHMAL
jgi:Flp pilus assembly pilin Flp